MTYLDKSIKFSKRVPSQKYRYYGKIHNKRFYINDSDRSAVFDIIENKDITVKVTSDGIYINGGHATIPEMDYDKIHYGMLVDGV